MSSETNFKFVCRDDSPWEQYVLCALLVPDVPNVYGDIYTAAAIKEFAEAYASNNYGLDINHDQEDVKNSKVVLVESFIVRKGDPDFVEGSWVVGLKVTDSEVWNDILTGKLNGLSYEAEVLMTPVLIQNLRNRQVSGATLPDPIDGHTHTFLVIVDGLNNPISGGTGVTNGHSHRIVRHTVTVSAPDDQGRAHSHRYQVLADEGEEDAAGA